MAEESADEKLLALAAEVCGDDPERQLRCLRQASVVRFLLGKIPDEDVGTVLVLMNSGSINYPDGDGGETEPVDNDPSADINPPRLRLAA